MIAVASPCLAAVFGVPTTIVAIAEHSDAPERIGPLKLREIPIDQLLDVLERWTGKTVLRPQQLPTAMVSLNLRNEVTKAEAIRAIETLLNLNGIAIEPLDEGFLKVTPLAAVKSEAPELIHGAVRDLPPSGRIACKLFKLKFVRVTEFIPQIAGLLNAAGGAPAVFDRANMFLVTDSISNLQRVEALIEQIDQPSLSGLGPRFYTLNFAKASDVINKLHSILSGPLQNQLGADTTISADDRSNQIILMADPLQYAVFDELVAKLDVQSGGNARNDIIYLKHAAAKDVATTLSQLVSGQVNAARSSQDSARQAAPNVQIPASPLPGIAPVGGVFPQNVESSAQFSPLLTIIPDERSNSIIVSGTIEDLRLIREMTEKIDVVLAQVRIDVIIAEVTLQDTDTSGIAALNLTVGQAPNSTSSAAHITSFAGAVAGWTVSSGVVNPLSFAAALADTGSKNKVKILTAPTIVTTHNKEAEIIVGQSQPIITGTVSTPISSGTSTAFATSSQVTYKDIAIDLKLTPLIGDDGLIQLKIDQRVDDILGNVTIDGNVQPIIGRRQATSFINVYDGQMVVLGGMQRTSLSNDRTKMGFLTEIPIVSQLLGSRTDETDRTELLLFIRPHVLKPQEDTPDTVQSIDKISSKKQVNEYIKQIAPSMATAAPKS